MGPATRSTEHKWLESENDTVVGSCLTRNIIWRRIREKKMRWMLEFISADYMSVSADGVAFTYYLQVSLEFINEDIV